MNRAFQRPVSIIVMLAAMQGLTVFIPISVMKLMPEDDWLWNGILVLLVLLFTTQLFLSFRWFSGRRCAAAVAASVGFAVIGLPVIGFAAFLVSLMIGTFVFPPR